MSIQYAILGLLSYKPLTGYDLKRIMQESPFMYWSGNNNQIYKALLELNEEGYVTNEVLHQDSSPSKKIYTITQAGLTKLKQWTLSLPEAPEARNTFLVQLAWTAQLNNNEIGKLLDAYEQEVKGQFIIAREKRKTGFFSPDRTPREAAIWELLYENILKRQEGELEWVNKVRLALQQFDSVEYETNVDSITGNEKEKKTMEYRIVEKDNQKYINLGPAGALIQSERDALELLSVCAENGTNLLLIHGDRLSDEFLQLKTGVAGAILQKFVMYNIKTVAVLDGGRIKGKFRELISESNRGNTFRVYEDLDEAERWLLNNNQ